MTRRLPSSASVAKPSDGLKLFAPAAERNTEALCELLRHHAPNKGRALELASGTGQHIAAFAKCLPELSWQPTDIDIARRNSIDAYREEAALGNLLPAELLDATQPGWSADYRDNSLIVLINLLHLINEPQAKTVLTEAIAALAAGGRFMVYGPFKRDGVLISDGDARFHLQLSTADPEIGYKDSNDVTRWLLEAGATDVKTVEMPANNLAFVATR